jgi:hypothetical protein
MHGMRVETGTWTAIGVEEGTIETSEMMDIMFPGIVIQ